MNKRRWRPLEAITASAVLVGILGGGFVYVSNVDWTEDHSVPDISVCSASRLGELQVCTAKAPDHVVAEGADTKCRQCVCSKLVINGSGEGCAEELWP